MSNAAFDGQSTKKRGTESNVQRDVLPLTVYVGLARTVHMHRI